MENIEVLKAHNVDVEEALGLWGDMESYNDALKEYMTSFPSKLKTLEEYIATSDWNNYAVLAHSIKSESKYLGFMKESEVFLDHELKGKANDGVYIKDNYNKLKETANQIVRLLNEYFGEKKNLLVADDSNIILSFLEKNIPEEYNVLKASDGNEAINKIKECPIYAILLDLNMPSINGFEVLEYLKKENLIHEIPIVIITGDDSDETIKKAFDYPILDVLNKPFNESNIKSILTSINHFYQNK